MLRSNFMSYKNDPSIKISKKSTEDELILSSDVVFSELNFHKRAALLFPPTNTVKVNESRNLPVKIADSNGKMLPGSISIQPGSGLTPYTTTSYDVLVGLIVLWREAGEPNDLLAASFNQLWMAMGHTSRPGSGEINMLLRELDMLHRNFLSWTSSYLTEDETISDKESYNILSKLDIHEVRDRKTGQLKKGGFSFVFHETSSRNLKGPNTVLPVNSAARNLVKNRTAKAIQPHVETTLTGFIREAYNHKSKAIRPLTISTQTLLEKHLPTLDPKNYQAPSKQERLCNSIAKAFNGIPLSIEGYKIESVALKSSSKSKPSWMVSFSAVKDESYQPPQENEKLGKVNHEVYDLLYDTLGDDNNTAFYTLLSRKYDHTLISRAIGNWKESIANNPDIENIHGYFTETLHRMVHEMGLDWIKNCGADCKYINKK